MVAAASGPERQQREQRLDRIAERRADAGESHTLREGGFLSREAGGLGGGSLAGSDPLPSPTRRDLSPIVCYPLAFERGKVIDDEGTVHSSNGELVAPVDYTWSRRLAVRRNGSNDSHPRRSRSWSPTPALTLTGIAFPMPLPIPIGADDTGQVVTFAANDQDEENGDDDELRGVLRLTLSLSER